MEEKKPVANSSRITEISAQIDRVFEAIDRHPDRHLPLGSVGFSMLEKFGEIASLILEALPAYAERARGSFRVFAELGWYPDIWGQGFSTLVRTHEELGPAAVDAVFVEHFQTAAKGIIEEVASRYPVRGAVLRDALWAHELGRYTLSVPIYLIQADGIFQEELIVRNRKARLYSKRALEELSGVMPTEAGPLLTLAMLEPFKNDAPLSLPEARRSVSFRGLNRHRVLHGEDSSYGTRENSLKAISWLWYVVCVIEDIDRNVAKAVDPNRSDSIAP